MKSGVLCGISLALLGDRRLTALHRLQQIHKEVNDYYQLYTITDDLIELRNLVQTSKIIVESAYQEKKVRTTLQSGLNKTHNSVIMILDILKYPDKRLELLLSPLLVSMKLLNSKLRICLKLCMKPLE